MKKVGAEREIIFDKSLRYARQKDYDIKEYEMVPYHFKDGGDKQG